MYTQEVMGRTNSLLSFDTMRTKHLWEDTQAGRDVISVLTKIGEADEKTAR
jgi:hypothetical protein